MQEPGCAQVHLWCINAHAVPSAHALQFRTLNKTFLLHYWFKLTTISKQTQFLIDSNKCLAEVSRFVIARITETNW